MTTATLETAPPISKLATELNANLAAQESERQLHDLDRCDRCAQAAQASFVFVITNPADPEGSGKTETDVLLCGHHTRQHLPALLAKNPTSYWIEPSELYTIRGVKIPGLVSAKSGDGLTDA